MFLRLFQALRAERVPVTPREWLDLLAVLQSDVVPTTPETLHGLARTVLVKDERHYDRFDRAFGRYLQDVAAASPEDLKAVIPEDWLRAAFGRELSEDDKAKLQHYAATTPIVVMVRFSPAQLDADALIGLLRPLTPRLYSIASSQAEVESEVHITVGVVRYDIEGRARAGGRHAGGSGRLRAGR